MSTRDRDSRLMDYLYDELDSSERSAFEREIEADDALRADVEGLRATRILLQNAEDAEAPGALMADIMRQARLAASPEPKVGFFEKLAGWLTTPAFATGALAVTLLAVGGYYASNGSDPMAPSDSSGFNVAMSDEGATNTPPSIDGDEFETPPEMVADRSGATTEEAPAAEAEEAAPPAPARGFADESAVAATNAPAAEPSAGADEARRGPALRGGTVADAEMPSDDGDSARDVAANDDRANAPVERAQKAKVGKVAESLASLGNKLEYGNKRGESARKKAGKRSKSKTAPKKESAQAVAQLDDDDYRRAAGDMEPQPKGTLNTMNASGGVVDQLQVVNEDAAQKHIAQVADTRLSNDKQGDNDKQRDFADGKPATGSRAGAAPAKPAAVTYGNRADGPRPTRAPASQAKREPEAAEVAVDGIEAAPETVDTPDEVADTTPAVQAKAPAPAPAQAAEAAPVGGKDRKKDDKAAEVEGYRRSGLENFNRQRFDLALRDLKRYVDNEQRSKVAPNVHKNLAQSYERTNQARRAVDAYRRLLNDYPNYKNRAAVLIEMALLEARLGNLSEAKRLLQEASKDKAVAKKAKAELKAIDQKLAARKKKASTKRKAAGKKKASVPSKKAAYEATAE